MDIILSSLIRAMFAMSVMKSPLLSPSPELLMGTPEVRGRGLNQRESDKIMSWAAEIVTMS